MSDSAKPDTDRFDREPEVQSTSGARLSMAPEKKETLMAGWTALVKGDHNTALSSFQSVLREDGSSVEAQYGLASTYKAMGRRDEAIQAYEKTLAQIGQIQSDADRVRVTMLKHLAKSSLNDLKAGDKAARKLS